MADGLELEIDCRYPGGAPKGKTKFRGIFDFDNPNEIPSSVRFKVSEKTMGKILTLPYDEVLVWFEILGSPPLSFEHFWGFCHRFGGNRFEHGDPESYRKAELVLEQLVKNNYKMTNDPIPRLVFASHDDKKIALLQDALVKLECNIHQIPPIVDNRHAQIMKKWNEWLDERRDPKKVSVAWGDLDVMDV